MYPPCFQVEANDSGYIIFNIAMIFVITWLFFGGYKKFIPTKAVNKVRQRGKSVSSDEEKGQSQNTSGTDYTAQVNDNPDSQYLQEGPPRG
jgi:hypothetical protein